MNPPAPARKVYFTERLRDKRDDWLDKVVQMAANDKEIEDLKVANDDKATTDEVNEKNRARIAALKEQNAVMDRQADIVWEQLAKVMEALGNRRELVQGKDGRTLAANIYLVANSVATLQEHAAVAVAIALTQFGRAVPNAPSELTEMIKRWAAEGISDAPEKAKQLFADVTSVPGRLGKVGSLLGKSLRFNRAVANMLEQLGGFSMASPDFDAMLSEFTGKPRKCGTK